MQSQSGYNPYADYYERRSKQASGNSNADEGETLYATPIDGNAEGRQRSQDDFDRLCRDIGSSVSQITDALSKGLAQAGGALGNVIDQAVEGYRANLNVSQEKAELARQQSIIDARFGKISSIRTSGIVRCALGGLFSLSFGSALIEELVAFSLFDIWSMVFGVGVIAVLFGISLKTLIGGISRIKAAGNLKDYKRIMGNREAFPIVELARATNENPRKVISDIKYILNEGMIPEGHLDGDNTTFMVTDTAYDHYLRLEESQRQKTLERKAEQEAAARATAHEPVASSEGLAPEVQKFINKGADYIDKMHRLDVEIDDRAVSQKIVSIEGVVGKILDRAKEQPRVIDQLDRFMDYYLPTTIKLLTAYAALEKQDVHGENIESSRREIESTLDVLLQAYEKLLDATFADLSMDVSSEISVLNVVLAQEGLTEDPFDSKDGDERK